MLKEKFLSYYFQLRNRAISKLLMIQIGSIIATCQKSLKSDKNMLIIKRRRPSWKAKEGSQRSFLKRKMKLIIKKKSPKHFNKLLFFLIAKLKKNLDLPD